MDTVNTRRFRTLFFAVGFAMMMSLTPARPSPAAVALAAPASAALRGFPLGEPAYDSGWLSIATNATKVLTHNLGGNTDNYYVVLEGRDSGGSGRTIRHRSYGGDITKNSPLMAEGIAWHHLTTTAISVYRAPNDLLNDKIRVRIWVARTADYDSGWVTATPNAAQTLTHGLGGNVDQYLVYLEFRSASWGINQLYLGMDTYYGSVAARNFDLGGCWFNLTNAQIQVFAGRDSASTITDLRLRVWLAHTPDRDSTWQSVAPGSWLTFEHNLGGPWNDFVVDLEFKDSPGGYGINNWHYGGDCLFLADGVTSNCFGGFWTNFSANEIVVYRDTEDTAADQVRVRIWASSKPKYASTFDPAAPSAVTLTHNLGGSTDDYVVDLQFKNVMSGMGGTDVNQANYGGDLRCAGDPLAPKMFGAYWDHLTDSAIQINRFADDITADWVQTRIWVAAPADYDSDWFNIPAGAATTKTHNLGGETDDYVVYLEFRDTAVGGIGVHQRSYGGDWYSPTCGAVPTRVGGYWLQLTTTTIGVAREAEDALAGQMRVRIWRNAAADYNSTWTLVSPGNSTAFSHNLNWDPAGLVTYLTFHDTSEPGNGVNHRGYGVNIYENPAEPDGLIPIGAFWGLLTRSSVRVGRMGHDQDADEVRMRIWRAGPTELMLPIVTRP